MPRLNRFFACSLAVLLTSGVAAAQSSHTGSPGITRAALYDITTTKDPNVVQFQKIEDAWSTALNQRNQYTLENVLSSKFVNVSAAGSISNLNDQVARMLSNDDKTYFLTQKVASVRMLGDTAVVSGTYMLHHRAGSLEVNDRGVFTHIYQRTNGRWQCIDSQRTLIQPPSAIKQKHESAAGAAFHFPFFGHGGKDTQ